MKGGLRVALFGATGMVGHAVLEHCLADSAVASVLVVGRRGCGRSHPKLTEHLRSDFFDYSDAAGVLGGIDACFFCLGRSSLGLGEAEYTRDTHDLTLAAARALLKLNPGMAFCYVSGTGTDSSGAGRVMWARVKGRTENDLLALPFAHHGMVRLAALVPTPGFRSRAWATRLGYAVLGPLLPVLKRVLGAGMVLDGPTLGRAMVRVALGQSPKAVLEPRDLAELGRA